MAATSVGLDALINAGLPPRFHVPAGLAGCFAVSAMAARAGAGVEEQGLNLRHVPRGCLFGFAGAAPIAVALAAGLNSQRLRVFYRAEWITRTPPGQAAYEALVRIPLGTALPEEVIFRGALLAVLSRYHSQGVATAIDSLLFGLWHVAPALKHTRDTRAGELRNKAGQVAGSVAVTAAAGFLLAWLRIRSGSIVAPWLAHSAANVTGYAAVRLAARFDRRPTSRNRITGISIRYAASSTTTR
jgi:membrane protease YdiL (CAAX protease family)